MKADCKTKWKTPFPVAPNAFHQWILPTMRTGDTGQITFVLLENTTPLLSLHINIRADLESDEDYREKTMWAQ